LIKNLQGVKIRNIKDHTKMNTLGWGPHGWNFLFLTTIDYMKKYSDREKLDEPAREKLDKIYHDFFTFGTANILPCKWCRLAWTKFNNIDTCVVEGCYSSHLTFHLKTIPQSEKSKGFFRWLYVMKNKVR
jgi:hypothetical protein